VKRSVGVYHSLGFKLILKYHDFGRNTLASLQSLQATKAVAKFLEKDQEEISYGFA